MLGTSNLLECDGFPEIYRAISSRDIERLKIVLDSDDTDINELHDELINPLHYAICRGDYQIVKLLLDANALVDAPPPLIAQHSHIVQAVHLCDEIENNEHTEHMHGDNDREYIEQPILSSLSTSLDDAQSIVDLVLKHYNLNGPWFSSPHIVFHDESVMREFLKRNVDVNARDDKRRTPLYHVLSLAKPLSMIKTLLSYNANPNYIYGNNDNALHIALIYYPKSQQEELYHIIQTLLLHGADPNINRCMSNMTPLHLATTQGVAPKIMEILIRSGGDLLARAYDRTNILHSCLKHSKDKDGLMTETIIKGYLYSILSKDGMHPDDIAALLNRMSDCDEDDSVECHGDAMGHLLYGGDTPAISSYPPHHPSSAMLSTAAGTIHYPLRSDSPSNQPTQKSSTTGKRRKKVPATLGPNRSGVSTSPAPVDSNNSGMHGPSKEVAPHDRQTSLYKVYYRQLQGQKPKRYVFPHLKLKKSHPQPQQLQLQPQQPYPPSSHYSPHPPPPYPE